MDNHIKFLFYLFLTEFLLTGFYFVIWIESNQWLLERFILKSNNIEDTNLYTSLYFLIEVTIQIVIALIFLTTLRFLRQLNKWTDRQFDIKDKWLIINFIGILFAGRYLLYMIGDFAFILDQMGDDPSSPNTSFLIDLNLYLNRLSIIDNAPTGSTTGLAIFLIFIADILNALFIAFIHFLLLLLHTNYYQDDSEIDPLYPVNSHVNDQKKN